MSNSSRGRFVCISAAGRQLKRELLLLAESGIVAGRYGGKRQASRAGKGVRKLERQTKREAVCLCACCLSVLLAYTHVHTLNIPVEYI